MVTKVGLWKQPSDPATVAEKGYVYSKEVNLITELFYKDGSANVTQLTLNGKVKGNTLNQSYDEGGAGVGRTITVDSGPVTLVAGGAEALHADGYIGLTERGSDPTLLANSGLVYTKEVTGVTELFYMNTAGVTTQLTDNGAVPGMNKIQEGNTVAEVHDTGSDGYFFVRTEGGEKFRIGPNGGATFTPELNTSVNFNTSGTGLGVFANAIRVGTTTDTTAGNVRWTGTHFEGYGVSTWLQLDQTSADLTETGSDILTISGGTNAVMGSGTTIQIQKASAAQDGYLGKDDWAIFDGKQDTITPYNLTETTSDVLVISGTGSVLAAATIQVNKASAIQDGYLGKDDFASFSTSIHAPVTLAGSAVTGGLSLNVQELSFRAADTNYDGYLKSSDWDIFNGKQDTITPYNLTESTSDVLVISGTGSVLASATIQVNKASAAQDGYLSKGDWSTFNGKQDALTTYDLSETSSGILTISGGTDSVLTNNVTIAVQKASALQDGYLGKDDFASFSATGTMIAQLDTKAYVKDTGVDGYFAVETNAVERFRLTFDGGMVIPSSSAAPTASNAMTYYDTDDNKFKFYENGTWNELGGTLNTSYNYGGAGAGRTITVNSGAVTLTATGGEALHTDGYIGIIKKAADPTAVANMGSVYTKEVNGITELFYFDSTGSYTQITDDGYLATANSLYQVGLYTKTWDPHANIGEGFIYTKWVDIETDKHSEFYFMDDKAQVTQITKDGSLNVVLTSPNGFKFELAVDDDGKISSKKLQ
jgi:hypothetical protein